MKIRRLVILALVVVFLATCLPFNVFADMSIAGNGINVSFAITQQWSSGFNAEFNVTNEGSTAIKDWYLEFEFPHEILSIWNAEVVSHSNNLYVVKNVVWNSNVVPGSTISFGITGVSNASVVVPKDFRVLSGNVSLAEHNSHEDEYGVNDDKSTEFVVSSGTVSSNETLQPVLAYDFKIVGEWDGYYNAEVTLENISPEKIESWAISFICDDEIEYMWNAQIMKRNNPMYTVKNNLWNANIEPGEAVSFGFTAKIAGVGKTLSDVTLNTATKTLPLAKFDVVFSVNSDWGSGYNAQLEIKNNSDYTIENWSLEFDFNGNIDEIWNAKIVGHEEGFFLVKNVGYNSNIPAGGSINFGFNGSPGGIAENPGNFVLRHSGEYEGLLTVTRSCDDASDDFVRPILTIELHEDQIDSLRIDKVYNDYFLNDPEIPGYLGSAFDLNVDGEFARATLAFEIAPILFENSDFVPAIYYWDEEIQFLSEVPNQTIDGNLVSVELNHFSKYMVLAKNSHDKDLFEFEILPPVEGVSQNDRLDISLVLDESGSVSAANYTLMKNLANDLISNLDADDRIAVFTFASNVVKHSGFVQKDDATSVITGLSKRGGGTAIYNAINTANNEFITNSTDNATKVMIVLTDGQDGSSNISSTTVTQTAVMNGIIIYTIGVGSVNANVLRNIAEATGGEYYGAANYSQLAEIFNKLQRDVEVFMDSDNDGISDYHEKKIAAGQLRIGTGAPLKNFDSLDYQNSDSDGDGLPDGYEFVILNQYVENNQNSVARYYCFLFSNPCATDSDEDGLLDPIDPEPLIKNNMPLQKLEWHRYSTTDDTGKMADIFMANNDSMADELPSGLISIIHYGDDSFGYLYCFVNEEWQSNGLVSFEDDESNILDTGVLPVSASSVAGSHMPRMGNYMEFTNNAIPTVLQILCEQMYEKIIHPMGFEPEYMDMEDWLYVGLGYEMGVIDSIYPDWVEGEGFWGSLGAAFQNAGNSPSVMLKKATKEIICIVVGKTESEMEKSYYYIQTKIQTEATIMVVAKIMAAGSYAAAAASLLSAGVTSLNGLYVFAYSGGLGFEVAIVIEAAAVTELVAAGALAVANIAFSSISDRADESLKNDEETLSDIREERIKGWGDGGKGSSFSNAEDHYDKHGSDVGAKGFDDYLRKADAFKETVLRKKIEGHYVPGVTRDVYRYRFNGRYIDLQKISDGVYKIISYGL